MATPNRLRELMRERNVSPVELAFRVHRSEATIHRWASGAQIVDPKKHELAEYFGVTVPELMGWDTDADKAA